MKETQVYIPVTLVAHPEKTCGYAMKSYFKPAWEETMIAMDY